MILAKFLFLNLFVSSILSPYSKGPNIPALITASYKILVFSLSLNLTEPTIFFSPFATSLKFIHPYNEQPITISAKLGEHMLAVCEQLGWPNQEKDYE